MVFTTKKRLPKCLETFRWQPLFGMFFRRKQGALFDIWLTGSRLVVAQRSVRAQVLDTHTGEVFSVTGASDTWPS